MQAPASKHYFQRPFQSRSFVDTSGPAPRIPGKTAQAVTPFPAERTVRFKSSSRNFLISLSSCNDNGEECAVVTIGRGVRARVPLEVLNRLNDSYGGLIAASRVSDETFRILHASIIRGGVTKTNIAITLVWFMNESDAFASFINAQLMADGSGASASHTPVQLGDVVLAPAQTAILMAPLASPSPAAR